MKLFKLNQNCNWYRLLVGLVDTCIAILGQGPSPLQESKCGQQQAINGGITVLQEHPFCGTQPKRTAQQQQRLKDSLPDDGIATLSAAA